MTTLADLTAGQVFAFATSPDVWAQFEKFDPALNRCDLTYLGDGMPIPSRLNAATGDEPVIVRQEPGR